MTLTIRSRSVRITIALFLLGVFGASVAITEYLLRRRLGLGNPVIYEANLLYGYRPAPNQDLKRFGGSEIRINNLGLRANTNWDARVDNKILFLGDSITYGGSYISNDQLFSTLAVNGIDGYEAGNGGVNGWGVENIYGLIVKNAFLPASVYVSVLAERDFYRGLSKLAGQPYWSRKPKFALEELLYHFYFSQNLKRFKNAAPSEKEKWITAESAVQELKALDEFLKSRGFLHLVFITPERAQLLKQRPKDAIVHGLLQKHHVDVMYIVDKLERFPLSEEQKAALFYDDIHLSRAGHALWAKVIHDELVPRLTRVR